MKRATASLILCMALLGPAKMAWAGNIDNIRSLVYAWADAWQNRNIKHYASFYSPAFRSKELDFKGWMQKKTELFQEPGSIRVGISDLWIFIEGKNATAQFIQRYQGSKFSDVGEKTLVLVHSKDKWEIISEEWTPLVIPTRTPEMSTTSSIQNNFYAHNRPSEPVGQKNKKKSNKTIIKNIQIKTEENYEKFCIALNTFSIPKVQSIEGQKPRIVIDINNVATWSGKYKMPVNGHLIKQIRTYLHRDTETLRIVLDLKYADDYIIDQTFDKKTNIYSIAVK